MSATALPSEEDLLLTLSEARALLASLGRTVEKVVRACDDDAILFIGAFGRPWTAWLTREDGRIAAAPGCPHPPPSLPTPRSKATDP